MDKNQDPRSEINNPDPQHWRRAREEGWARSVPSTGTGTGSKTGHTYSADPAGIVPFENQNRPSSRIAAPRADCSHAAAVARPPSDHGGQGHPVVPGHPPAGPGRPVVPGRSARPAGQVGAAALAWCPGRYRPLPVAGAVRTFSISEA
jgi:hypothetical protein